MILIDNGGFLDGLHLLPIFVCIFLHFRQLDVLVGLQNPFYLHKEIQKPLGCDRHGTANPSFAKESLVLHQAQQ